VQVGDGDDERRRVDAELVRRAIDDTAAFGELYDRYVTAVYRYCYRRTGNRECAEDATSAIFTRTLEALADFRGGSFRAWLFAIAHSVLINTERRRRETLLPVDLETADPTANPEELALTAAEEERVTDVLRGLPDAQRQVVEFRLAGLTGSEIASALGRSVPAVKMLQLRAMKRLRAQLEHQPWEERSQTMADADDRHDADQLNRLWDQFILDGEDDTRDATGWMATLASMTAGARRRTPDPDPAFAASLRLQLLTTPRPHSRITSPPAPSSLSVVHPALLPSAPLLRRFGIAALLAVVIIGAIAGNSWLPPRDGAPIVASALASSIPGTPSPVATSIVLLSTAIQGTTTPDGTPVMEDAFSTVAPPASPQVRSVTGNRWRSMNVVWRSTNWNPTKDVVSVGS
jgi:RNA polymerase sigma-70 factor (ECF subfamily)